MNRKLIAALVLFFVAALGAFAQEDEGVSVDAWVGVSAGDVLSEAAFVTKYGVVLGNLFGTGLEAGIDELVWAVTPESSVGMDAYAEYGFGSADSPFAFGVGASTTLAFGDELLADAGLYGRAGYSVGGIEVAAAELDAGLLSANEGLFGLFVVAGFGYEFAIGESGALALWVDFNFSLYDEFDVGDIEGSVEYTHSISDAFALSLAVAPTVVMEDEASFALEPTLYARFAF